MRDVIKPLRAVVATLVGGAVGAAALGAVAGYGLSVVADEFVALGAAVVAAGIGALLGAGGGLAVAFRHEPARDRRMTIVTVLLAGPPVLGVLSVGFANVDPALSLPPLWLAITLPATAILGRWLVARRRDRDP